MHKGYKIIILIGWLMLSLSMYATSGKCGDNVSWNLNEQTGVLTISGSGPMWNWESQESPWYKNLSIKKVVVNSGVKSIGEGAFSLCESLSSITIPNSVTCIGKFAFYGCKSLTSITIPNSVTCIGKFAFDGCESLTSITIPNSVTNIGGSAFYGCNSLTSIIIPNSVTSIGEYAFWLCNNLTSITIPNSVTSIGHGAFSYCSSLTSIIVAEKNTKYDSRNNCNAIIETATNTLIAGCQNTVIPKNVTNIGEEAFCCCKGLTSITIPNSITSIGENAFDRCDILTSITIPNSVTSIGEGAFSGCSGLNSIIVAEKNAKYDSRNNCNAIIETATNTLIVGCQNTVIPQNVTNIGEEAFYCCKGLTSITIPNNVTDIGEMAFYYCTGLTSLIIPSSVISIGGWAFRGCTGLTSVTIGDGVTSIGEYAFFFCNSLTSIIIPNSVTSIGKSAFSDCKKIEEFYYPRGLDLSQAGISSKTKLIAYDPNNPPEVKPAQPPILSFIEGSLSFDDASNNNRIDANEQCAIKFKIINNGKGAAQNCEARVKLSGTKSGISVQNVKLPSIPVGQTYDINIPVSSNANTQDGNVIMSVLVYEPNGWGIAPFDIEVSTKAFVSPLVQIVDYNITSSSGKVHRMEPFAITFTVQNIKYGDAENVKLKIIIPNNVIIMEGSADLSFPLIKSGEKKSAQIVLAVNNNYEESSIPITFDIKEKYGKYAENKNLNIELAQTTPSTQKLTVKEEKTTYKIVSYKEMALAIAGTPRVSSLTNTSVSIMRPDWYNKYHNPQNIKSPFPYAVIQLELKGDKEAIDLAKQRLSLTMGGKHIITEKDTNETNAIWFLVHCRNEYIDLDCGDGCEPINIWNERLEPNKVYHGSISVSVQ